jgi:hypothetical protein
VVVAVPTVLLALITWYTVEEPKRGITEAALQARFSGLSRVQGFTRGAAPPFGLCMLSCHRWNTSRLRGHYAELLSCGPLSHLHLAHTPGRSCGLSCAAGLRSLLLASCAARTISGSSLSMVLQDNYESGDFEYEEKLDWEKTKKLAKIRTNLCVILQVGGLLVPQTSAAALYRHIQSAKWVFCGCEGMAIS